MFPELMNWNMLSLVVLLVSGGVVYWDMYRFFRDGKYPYFIGRPPRALKYFLLLEMAASIPIIALEMVPHLLGWGNRVFGIFAGLVEEPGKLAPIVWLAGRNGFFREYLKDGGWFYVGLIAGLAFGIFEGFLYSIAAFASAGSVFLALYSVFLGRLPVIALHALFTMVASWGYAGLLRGRRVSFVVGLGSAVLMHSLYDFLVYTGYVFDSDFYVFLATLVYPVAIIVYFLLKRRVREFYLGREVGWLFRVFIINR